MIRLTFGDFKQINFTPYFPSVINDLLEYLTGYSIVEFDRVKREKEAVEKHHKYIEDEVELERNANPLAFKE